MTQFHQKVSEAAQKCRLIGQLVTITLIISHLIPSAICRAESPNPLVYNRLRDDTDFLQLMLNLQQKNIYDEKPVKLKQDSKKQIVDIYYENNRFDASELTLNDLILEALDRTYESRYIQNYIYTYDNPEDKRKASDPALISQERCATELTYLIDKLTLPATSPVSPELAAFFDSFAKEETGVLFGNYHWTGNWRQCNKRLVFDLDRSNVSNSIAFRGRYCVASLRSDRWQAKIEQRAEERKQTYFKRPEQAYDYKRFFRIQVGICLPESCDSTTFDQAQQADIIRRLTVHKLGEPYKSYKLIDLFCLPDETSELRQLDSSGKLFVLAAVVWCSVIIAATCYDIYGPAKGDVKPVDGDFVDKLVSAISLKRNYARLTRREPIRVDQRQIGPSSCMKNMSAGGLRLQEKNDVTLLSQLSQEDLAFMNFFKVFCMPTILLGHMALTSRQSERFVLDYAAFDESIRVHYYMSAIFLIDWFFVMAAFIAVYAIFVSKKRVDRIPLVQWLYSIFHRYWRLAPMYIIVFWFCRSVFEHTGRGPVWDYGTSNMTMRGVCKHESWLWPTTLTSNLHPFHEECILPSWYVSMTMQFYLITPPILIGLARWPIVTWSCTLATIVASVLARIHRYYTDPHVQVLSLGLPRADSYTRNMFDMYPTYTYPQYRIPTYLVGLLAGHYTFMVLSGQWHSSFYNDPTRVTVAEFNRSEETAQRSKSRKRGIIWFTSAILLILLMFTTCYPAIIVPKSFEPYARGLVSFFYGISHILDGLVFALLLITFMFGQFRWLRANMSRHIWTLVSRLNFSLLLIHSEIAYLIHQSNDHVPNWTESRIPRDWILLMCFSYPLAVIVTLLLELPLSNLEREFIGNKLKSRSSHKSQSEVAGQESEASDIIEVEKPNYEDYQAAQNKGSKLDGCILSNK